MAILNVAKNAGRKVSWIVVIALTVAVAIKNKFSRSI